MNILILDANTEQESLSAAICNAYKEGAEHAGHEVRLIHIGGLQFDPVLHDGYHSIQEPEQDLKMFQQQLLWCRHFVVVYPTWWGGPPAILKGLFDRSFCSGFAYKYHDKDPLWDKLLKGRSAHLITTMDAPYLWYVLASRKAGTHMLRNAILKFCGFNPVHTSFITRIKYKSKEQLAKDIAGIKNKAQQI